LTLPRRPRVKKRDLYFGLAESSASKHLVMVGIPWDATSSYHYGAAAGPNAIRLAMDGSMYNRFTEEGDDLAVLWRVCDHGNIKLRSNRANIPKLEKAIHSAVKRHNHEDAPTIFFGGDHFVTYPSFCVMSEIRSEQLALLYFDAHPDLYEAYDESPYSDATVVSRILERKDTSSGIVCYVGIRASTGEQDKRIKSFGLTEFTARDVYDQGCEAISTSLKSTLSGKPVYISIDMDCLDPAFAPGVGIPQAGGLSTRQLFDILHGIKGLEIVAADIVEYSPDCDPPPRRTAYAASILIKELMGIMARPAD